MDVTADGVDMNLTELGQKVQSPLINFEVEKKL
jgi:hypothetical protein